jgi:hypothetical protein
MAWGPFKKKTTARWKRTKKTGKRDPHGYGNFPFQRVNSMKRKRKKNISLPGFLVATKKNGKRVKANTSVKMSLHDLRRLVSGARRGKTVKVKARVR